MKVRQFTLLSLVATVVLILTGAVDAQAPRSQYGRDPRQHGLARRVLGTVYQEHGDLSQAEQHLRESLAVLESIEHRYEVARTLVDLVLALPDAGEEEEAQTSWQRAITIFEGLGAEADLEGWNRLVCA